MPDGSSATNATTSGQVPLANPRPKRRIFWPEVQHEVAEYFGYEPRVAACNPEGGSPTDPFNRMLQFPGGAAYVFMARVYDRLQHADRLMPYVNDGKRKSPSASMTLRAAYGATATAYDDSAPGPAARWLKEAQQAYAEAATNVGPRYRESAKAKILRKFDLVLRGHIQEFPRSDDD